MRLADYLPYLGCIIAVGATGCWVNLRHDRSKPTELWFDDIFDAEMWIDCAVHTNKDYSEGHDNG
jgi:hypothetical protein